MDALEMALLFDYYGGMLTDKQRDCFDMRYNQDLSLGEIAQELGVSRQAVSKWERGVTLPDVQTMLDLGRLFGVSLEQLLTGPIADAV